MPDDLGTGGFRKLVEDLLAPSLGRLEEKVSFIVSGMNKLSDDIARNQVEIMKLWEHFGKLQKDIGKVEGRIESASKEITAEVKLALLEYQQESRQLKPGKE